MLRLIGLMISIGFADSMNPSTIAPALYLATGKRDPRRQVMQFTLGVFAVYLLGGLAVALGPGELVLDLVPHPRPGLKYLFEIIGGVVLLTLAGALWSFRKLLAKRELPETRTTEGRSSLVLGAAITAVELPTAFPYFAAIAAAVGSGYGIWHQVFLILIFNVTFVLPLLAIIAVLQFAGPDAQRVLNSSRSWLERHWPVALAVVGLVAGAFCVFIGITGLVGLHHSHAGSVARKIRGIVAK